MSEEKNDFVNIEDLQNNQAEDSLDEIIENAKSQNSAFTKIMTWLNSDVKLSDN